jgi:hypothetical protein
MTLHSKLNAKALFLPPKEVDEEFALQKRKVFFAQPELYGEPPDHRWNKLIGWLEKPYFTQLLDKLLPAYIALSAKYDVNPQGFISFSSNFKGGYSSFLQETLKAKPDPYSQSAHYYESIKVMLEKIYFILSQPNGLTQHEIKKQLSFLSDQLTMCGTGLYETLLSILHDITTDTSLPYWLEDIRHNLVENWASQFMEKVKDRQRILWNPSLHPTHTKESYIEWFDENYNAHAHSGFGRRAKEIGFPIYVSEGLSEVVDKYEKKLGITKEDVAQFERYVYSNYTPKLIINSIRLRFNELLTPFKGTNLKEAGNFKKFIAIISPFLERTIFCIEDITTQKNKDELVLKPSFFDNLYQYCNSLLIEEGYIKDPLLEAFKDIGANLEADYVSLLLANEQPNPRRVNAIQIFKEEMFSILYGETLTKSEKALCALGLIESQIELINAEHSPFRQWVKKPLRWCYLTIFETRLEKLLKTLHASLVKAHHLTEIHTAISLYTEKHEQIQKQQKINAQNKDLLQQSDLALSHILKEGNKQQQSAIELCELQDRQGIHAFHFNAGSKPAMLVRPDQIITFDDINTICVFSEELHGICLEKSLRADYGEGFASFMTLHRVTKDELDIDTFNQAINLRRLTSLFKSNVQILDESCQNAHSLLLISKLNPFLISLKSHSLLVLIKDEDLSEEKIKHLNRYISSTENLFDAMIKLKMILTYRISLDKLPRLVKLHSHLFSPETMPSISLLSKSNQLTDKTIALLNNTIAQEGKASTTRIASILNHPEAKLDKLASLLSFPPSLYLAPEGVHFLISNQSYLPEYEEILKETLRLLTPSPLFKSIPTPAMHQQAKIDCALKGIANLTLLLESIPMTLLSSQTLIDKLKSREEPITKEYASSLSQLLTVDVKMENETPSVIKETKNLPDNVPNFFSRPSQSGMPDSLLPKDSATSPHH